MFSIQATWDDSIAFIRRERALLLPLALATLGLGNMATEVVQAASPLAKSPVVAQSALLTVLLVALLWIFLGQLAIITLALRNQCSVGEALRHAATRLGVNLLILAMFVLALVVLCLPPLVAIAPYAPQIQRNDLSHVHFPGWAILWLIGAWILAVYVSTRLFVLSPVTIDRKGDVLKLIKQSFAATHGVFWRLLAFTFGYALFTLIVQAAIAASFGIAFALLGKMTGSPFTGKVLESLVQSLLVSGLGLVGAVFSAKAYQRLSRTTLDAPRS